MNFLGIGSNAEVDISLEGSGERKQIETRDADGLVSTRPLYLDGENVAGTVHLILKRNSKLDHQGVKIELIGLIENLLDHANNHKFLNLREELARPGILMQTCCFPFEFKNVSKPYESYSGNTVKLRYFLRVTVVKRFANIVKEIDIAVHALAQYPERNNSITMVVGIDESLHIELEYNKSRYHLKDLILGKIYFLLVRVKIKNMELQIIRRELTGTNCYPDDKTVCKFELMDGSPVRGECVPIRLFLNAFELTPTIREADLRFSVRYLLNLVLTDEEDRRYYKQEEIILYREADRRRRQIASANVVQSAHHTAAALPEGKDNSDNENELRDSTQSASSSAATGVCETAYSREESATQRYTTVRDIVETRTIKSTPSTEKKSTTTSTPPPTPPCNRSENDLNVLQEPDEGREPTENSTLPDHTIENITKLEISSRCEENSTN